MRYRLTSSSKLNEEDITKIENKILKNFDVTTFIYISNLVNYEEKVISTI
ncbi:MAG TPA: hypothetical protein P5277_02185 [Candidatus Paceibacterota bacterium]|nr:hypothetical protein [Candidatus Paceibacterota bacterium]